MKREAYLDDYIKLLEQSHARALKDLERERKRVDFLEGKCERLELVVMSVKSDAGREYAERSDRAAEPAPSRKPKIERVPAAPTRIPFKDIREKWSAMTEQEQEAALAEQNLDVKPKEASV